MRIFRLIWTGGYRCVVAAVGLLSGGGWGHRSDYWGGDKDAIVPEPLPSKTSRERRRRSRRLREMDE